MRSAMALGPMANQVEGVAVSTDRLAPCVSPMESRPIAAQCGAAGVGHSTSRRPHSIDRAEGALPMSPPATSTRLLLFGLLLLCLIPRGLMAWKIHTVCPDATRYIAMAAALEKGDLHGALGELRVNTLPVALATLHRLGFDWEAAGKLWGVVLSSLVVLPLFGWACRQFDQPVATVACVLYAVHPGLIEWSPEIVREPTFWFFFTLSLYLSWRAASEGKLAWFLAAGLTIVLSLLTRFEGFFLAIPAVGWVALAWCTRPPFRTRLLLGALTTLAATCALAAISVFWVGASEPSAVVRLAPLRRVEWWLNSWSPKPGDATVAITPASGHTHIHAYAHTLKKLGVYGNTLLGGLHPIYACLICVGIVSRALWRRWDCLPLALVACAVAGGTWIHLGYAGLISSRYATAILLMGLPVAAGGLWSIARAVNLRASVVSGRFLSTRAAAAALLVLMGGIGWADALSTDYGSRDARARIGKWAAEEFGDSVSILCSADLEPMIGYYSRGRCRAIPDGLTGDRLVEWIEAETADVVLISSKVSAPDEYARVVQQCERLGLVQVVDPQLTSEYRTVLVLARVVATPAPVSRTSGVTKSAREPRGGPSRLN